MRVATDWDGTRLTLIVSGELDSKTSPELERVIEENLNGVKELYFDLEELEYTSSAGLRVFLQAQKIMDQQGTMKLIHVNDAIMDIFHIIGFDKLFSIEQ